MKKITKYLLITLVFCISFAIAFMPISYGATKPIAVATNGWVQDQIKYYGHGHGGSGHKSSGWVQDQVKYYSHGKQHCYHYYTSKYMCKGYEKCYWKHGKKYCQKYGCGWYPVKMYKCTTAKYHY